MSSTTRHLLRFGPYEFDRDARLLRRDGTLVPLPPKAFDLLAVLLEHAGAVVDKATLMERLWPDTFVEEGNLPVTMFALRKALGDPGESYIRTVPRRGYCFSAAVTSIEAAAGPVAIISPEPVAEATTPVPGGQPLHGAATTRRHARTWWVAAGVGAAALLATLVFVRSGGPATGDLAQVQSLAVLPFIAPATPDHDGEPIGVGLASAVASELVGLDEVIVRPFSSGAKFVGPAQDPIEAGRWLQVDAVLTGAIRPVGSNTQVSAALVRVSDGARMWTHTTTVPAGTLARAERTLVAGLAAALEPNGGAADTATPTRPVPGEAAYDAYLHARAAAGTWTVREVERAVAYYTDSVGREPGFADAQAGLAALLVLPPTTTLSRDTLARAKASARLALAVDPMLSEAQSALGRATLLDDWDWAGAERAFRAGIAAAPYDAEPHVWYAQWLSAQARHDEALAEIRLAQDIDPTSPRVNLYVGTLLLAARRFAEGAAQLRKTPIEMGVVNQQVYLASAVAHTKQQRWDDAFTMVERMVRVAPVGPARAYRAYILAEAGRGDEADRLLTELAGQPDTRRTPHIVLAAAYACRGRLDEAFVRLDRAYAERDPRLLFLKVDPMLDCLRGDPRYATAVRRIGLEP